MIDHIDIRIERLPTGEYQAIDANTYDCDCDQDGFYSVSPVGWGHSPLTAALDLIELMMDQIADE